MTPAFLPRTLTALAAVAAVALPVAGCGGSESSTAGGAGDPAAAVPAKAPIYVDVVLRPQGELRTNTEAVLGKLLDTSDPGGKIEQFFDKNLGGSGLTFRNDFEPWLGDRAGVGVLGLKTATQKTQAVVVIDSRDDTRATATLNQAKDTKPASYRGVDYRTDGHTAAGVIDGQVLIGDVHAFEAAVDVKKGADALSGVDRFKKVRDKVKPDGGIGSAYLDLSAMLDAAARQLPPNDVASLQALRSAVAKGDDQQVGVTLTPDAGGLRAEGGLFGAQELNTKGDAPGAAASVPADAWVSFGIGNLGGMFNQVLDRMGGGQLGAIDPQALAAQLKATIGIDIQKELLSWMGNTALYVGGSSFADLKGAVIVHSTDPAASQAAVPKLGKLLATFGKKPKTVTVAGVKGLELETSFAPVQIAAKGDRFVIAYGMGGAEAALGGGNTLGQTPGWREATSRLGGAQPTVYVDLASLVKTIAPLASGGKKFDKAAPTLKHLGVLAASTTGGEKDVQRFKLSLTVK